MVPQPTKGAGGNGAWSSKVGGRVEVRGGRWMGYLTRYLGFLAGWTDGGGRVVEVRRPSQTSQRQRSKAT